MAGFIQLSSNDAVLAGDQINYEWALSTAHANQKKIEFQERKKDFFLGPDLTDPMKSRINLVYENVNNLMGFFLMNKMSVDFRGRASDEKRLDLVNKKAESDYRKMKMDRVEHDSLFDMFLCGPGITMFDGYLVGRNCPIVSSRDVTTFNPDPVGRGDIENFRFFGFDGYMTKQEMLDRKYVNLENLVLPKDRKDLLKDYTENTLMSSAYYQVYHHYFKKNGLRYLATVTRPDGEKSKTLLVHNLVQIDVKVDGEYVWPGVIEYFFPQRNSWHGGSVYDLTYDKQTALSCLFNSAIYKTVRASVGASVLVDDSLTNLENFRNLTLDPKVIPVDTSGGIKKLADMYHEVERNVAPDDTYTLQDRLYKRAFAESGTEMGEVGDRATSQEVKVANAPQEARMGLIDKRRYRAKGDFWQKWYALTSCFMSEYKINAEFSLPGRYRSRYFSVDSSTFKENDCLDVFVVSKRDEDAENDAILIDYMAIYAIISEIAKDKLNYTSEIRKAARYMLKLKGFGSDEVSEFVPLSYDESKASEQARLLKDGVDVTGSKTDLWQDHEAYLSEFGQLNPTMLVQKAIDERSKMLSNRIQEEKRVELASLKSGGTKKKTGDTSNAIKNQLVSSTIAKSKK